MFMFVMPLAIIILILCTRVKTLILPLFLFDNLIWEFTCFEIQLSIHYLIIPIEKKTMDPYPVGFERLLNLVFCYIALLHSIF